MGRRQKIKTLTGVPQRFDPRFFDQLNQNYLLGRVVRERREALEAHCGGNPSYVQASLIKRVIWLELLAESYEQQFADGVPIDAGALSQIGNTLKGYYKDLGAQPVARNARRLVDVMRDSSPSAAA